jgi:hypothetical protein
MTYKFKWNGHHHFGLPNIYKFCFLYMEQRHALCIISRILQVRSRVLKDLTSTPPFSLRVCDTKAIPSAVAFALARMASASPDEEVPLIDVNGKSN